MISEILGKALIVVKADTKQAVAEIKLLEGAEKHAAEERVKAQNKVNEAWDNALKKHALMTAAVGAGVSIAIAAVEKYKQHLIEMGDTGGAQLKAIEDASKAAAKAQDTLQIALGKIVVAALPVVEAFAAMAQELGNIAGGIARVVQMATNIPGGGYVGTGLKWLRRTGPMGLPSYALSKGSDLLNQYYPEQYMADTNNLGGGIATTEGDSYQSESRETVSPQMAKALGWVYVSSGGIGFWRPPTEDEKRARETKRKAGARAGARQAQIYADAWRGIQGQIDITSGKASAGADGGLSQRSIRDFTDEELLAASGDSFGGADFDQFGSYEDIATERLDKSIEAAKQLAAAAEQRESLLASVFGPVEEFEMYSRAWTGLEQVVSAGFDAWITGSKSVGQAMKEALHGFAKQLAGEALLQALRHGAYALGSLAFGDVRGAGQHGLAAAKWGAVAVAAGYFAKETRPAPSGGNAAAGIGGGGGGRSGGPVNTTVVIGDGFADSSPRYVARRTRRAMDLAHNYAEYGGSNSG